MVEFFRRLFDTSDFPARWRCGDWSPALGWLHILSDLAIFGAYFAIPAALFFFIRRRRDVPLRGVFWLFIAFIFACGTTHLIEAIIFWEPVYRFSGLVKLLTALISWATVVALLLLAPEALSLPSIRAANEALRAEVLRRQEAERILSSARDDLEQRSSQLTLRERRVNSAMRTAHVCALHWNADTGAIDWSLGAEPCLELLGLRPQPFDGWLRLLGEEGFERLRRAAVRAVETGEPLDSTIELDRGAGAPPAVIRIAASVSPDEEDGGRMLTGMLRVTISDGRARV